MPNLKTLSIVFLLAAVCFNVTAIFFSCGPAKYEAPKPDPEPKKEQALFIPPDTSDIPHNPEGDLIRYGRELIVHTAMLIGPEGTKGKFLGNKMNCTNCHLDAGTRPFGLNYFTTHARYPQYRARENRVLSLAERVNNCIERPHMGNPLPLDSREMNAIITYIKWVGTNTPVGGNVNGDKPIQLDFPDEACDTANGRLVYIKQCQSCHGADGEGKLRLDQVTYEYPPLWGLKSYPPGSSMYRIIKAAQFIKANMPFGTTWKEPKLTDKEALDVAAYINSDVHKRPVKRGDDYPNITTKPVDHPMGPYNDEFSERQHKYGPYKAIIEYRKKNNLVVNF